MSKVGIGAGFVIAALPVFNVLGNIYAGILLLIVGAALIFHGSYDE